MKKLGILFLMTFLLISSASAYTVTRSVPSTAIPSSTFTVNYQVNGASGSWGISIVDNVIGGCLFPNSVTQLKTVMLSSDGNTKTITMTAPSSGTSCVFEGDSKYGTDAIVNFPTATVTIGGICTDTSWSPNTSTVCSGTSFTQTSNCGKTRTSTGTKTGCNGNVTTTCSTFFSETMNWYAFTDNNCKNGYIITGILGFVVLLIIIKLLK